jgi:hypothetical protein
MQREAHFSLPLVNLSHENSAHYKEPPRAEADMLQDYYQQAVLSDGLQRIDERTYVVQDWNGRFGVLEVRLHVLTLVNGV